MIEIKFTALKFMIYNPEREKPTQPNPQIPEVDPDRKESPTKPNPRQPEIEPDHWEEKPTEPNPQIPERPPFQPGKDGNGVEADNNEDDQNL